MVGVSPTVSIPACMAFSVCRGRFYLAGRLREIVGSPYGTQVGLVWVFVCVPSDWISWEAIGPDYRTLPCTLSILMNRDPGLGRTVDPRGIDKAIPAFVIGDVQLCQ